MFLSMLFFSGKIKWKMTAHKNFMKKQNYKVLLYISKPNKLRNELSKVTTKTYDLWKYY